ncbi:response regulator transcription factor [Bradyrhizobium sp.]|jgi:DNA-binding NarL/FixJ family response regulator|uniref:response regulator transcription factor n=1 Tax=Bradyrhizobium sp. TaxID=376 RepID=UPI002DDCC8DA|nr:response regulator transcription factor [Bradyrhizobium sp.]HEV2160385.1 response regulator transcription factor [Bradyrhizobium sp.]
MSSNASFPAGRHAPLQSHFAISHPSRPPAALDSGGVRPVRLFILSDVRLLCEGLGSCLARQECLHITGHGDLATPPEQIIDSGAQVLLVDIATPRGLTQSAACRALSPSLKVVAIAVAEVEQDILACAEAGVSGFVLRDGSIGDVVAAVHNAMRDELVCSPKVAAALFGRLATLSSRAAVREPAAGVDTLTPREHEIIRFAGEGLSNKEIARALRIRNSTVKNHMHNVLSKLQIRRRGEISKHLHANGWLASPTLRVQTR